MDEKEAAAMNQMALNSPQFAELQGICSEMAQAQENALNNTHDALHMQMIMFSQKTAEQTHPKD